MLNLTKNQQKMIAKIQSQTLRLINLLQLTRYKNEQDLRFIQSAQFYY